MITIGIDPILISIGPFALSWHGLFVVAAIAVGVWLPARLTARVGLPVETLYSMAIWAIPGGIIGARLVHVIDRWDYYLANPGAILAFWEGGLALWGAILGGTLAAVMFAKIKDFPIAGYADLIGIALILGQAIGRIGDVINGEHISKITSLPWGVVYTHPHSPSYGRAPSHLAVGYELIMDLVIFGLLWKLRSRVRPDGALFLLYLIIFSSGRFFLSSLRLDSYTVILGINQQQWLSLIVLAVASTLMIIQQISYRKRRTSR